MPLLDVQISRSRQLHLAIVMFFIASIMTIHVAAQEPVVHELHLPLGVHSIPLQLVDRGLAPDGPSYGVITLSPPTLGTLIGEQYQPAEAFWSAGVDQFTIEIQPSEGPDSQHTFILIPTTPSITITYDEDFSNSFPPTSWDIEPDPSSVFSIVPPGPEGLRLEAHLQAGAAPADISKALGVESSFDDEGTQGNHAIGGAGTTIPGPPGDVQSDGSVNVLVAGPIDEVQTGGRQTPEIYVQLRMRSQTPAGVPLPEPVYEMRAASCEDPESLCPQSSTPWRIVAASEPVRYSLWSGPRVIDGNTPQNRRAMAFNFSLDSADPLKDTSDWLEGRFDISQTRYGFDQATGLGGFSMVSGNYKSWTENYFFDTQTLVFEDFEGSAATTIDGPVGVNNGTALEGVYYAEVDVTALETGTPRDALVTSDNPSSETDISAHLNLDLSSLSLDDGESLRLFCGSGHLTNISTFMHLSIVLIRQAGSYKIRAMARDKALGQFETPTYTLSGQKHRLVLRWQGASGEGEDDGSVALWVDGILAGERTEIDNYYPARRLIKNVGFGAFHPNLTSGATTSPNRLIYMDDLLLVRH